MEIQGGELTIGIEHPVKARITWEQSERIGELVKAVCRARPNFGDITKDKEGKIQGEARGSGKAYSYSYRYSSLDQAIDATADALAAEEVAVFNTFEEGTRLITVYAELVHSSDQYKRGRLSMPVEEMKPHAIGSAITYARRYLYMGLLNLAPSDDDDGNAAQRGSGGGASGSSGARGGEVAPEEVGRLAAGGDMEAALERLTRQIEFAQGCGDLHPDKMRRIYEAGHRKGYPREQVDKILHACRATPGRLPWKAFEHALALFENAPAATSTPPSGTTQKPAAEWTWPEIWDAIRESFDLLPKDYQRLSPTAWTGAISAWSGMGWTQERAERVLRKELKIGAEAVPSDAAEPKVFKMIARALHRFAWDDVAEIYPPLPPVAAGEMTGTVVAPDVVDAAPDALGQALAPLDGGEWLSEGFEAAFSTFRVVYQHLASTLPEVAAVAVTPDDRMELFKPRSNGGRRAGDVASMLKDMLGLDIEKLPSVLFPFFQALLQRYPIEDEAGGVAGTSTPTTAPPPQDEVRRPKIPSNWRDFKIQELADLVKGFVAQGFLSEDEVPRSGNDGTNVTKRDLVAAVEIVERKYA